MLRPTARHGQVPLSRTRETPTCGERVGRFFRIGDVPPGAVPQVGMGQLVRDHIVRKILTAQSTSRRFKTTERLPFQTTSPGQAIQTVPPRPGT